MTMTNNATTNYTPIRTDVFSTCSSVVFAGWADTNITQGGTCATGITTTGYLRLIQSTSSASSPTMDFSNSSAGKLLNFRIRQDGAVS
jgi:hypothetical protein